jgi:hypothetical protein
VIRFAPVSRRFRMSEGMKLARIEAPTRSAQWNTAAAAPEVRPSRTSEVRHGALTVVGLPRLCRTTVED